MELDVTTALSALRDLRAQLEDALRDGYPPGSSEVGASVVADLVELAELTMWCRDAGVAYARLDDAVGWEHLGATVGVPFQTLQGWRKKYYERKAEA